ncbi:4-(cytidine 5'-diphospho)-2-C-methyl-D-erythritol kinase [Fusobacterium polymorphum]|uniref:4-diphosphocytidyl-2-C-methyl-D-erythritol kinase n=1 Tax=Fusobacterium nucleatum subsp. polymorphum TaxID=76857 RepID=A0A241Q295_FUSNP|nr:4-(cytidine 5'-diphospho)-2-C-methyl-D-erythritol kinase [Fusobacterium polymorphum]
MRTRISLNKYKIFSNAKINIGLNVFQKESDGYHNIDSIMVPIDLADEMDVTFYSDLGNLKIECSDKNIPTDERNILYKTYKAFFEESKKEKRKIDIILKKNIPSEAGLGGGSSNAGFFLKLLNEYYGNIYNESELEELAMKIGSDVPFFIKNKTARVGGKGNKVDLVENNLKDSIILIKPLDFGVSTKEAYESFDNLKEVKYANFDKIIECLKDNNRIALENSIENSLEQGILETDINIKMLKITLNSVISGKKFFMSGSGSTYYTFVTELEKSQIETRLKTFVDNVKIIICKTIN